MSYLTFGNFQEIELGLKLSVIKSIKNNEWMHVE